MSTDPHRALERLYREDGPKLWRSLFAFGGDREVASDSMAEAFAQALGRGGAVRDHRRWVWRAAFRIASGELQERRKTQPIEREPAFEDPDPVAGELLRVIATLSQKQRAAVILHDYVGCSTAETARILSSSAATVRVHLSQGRRRLRRLLESEPDDA